MRRIFLISPVRGIEPSELNQIADYVKKFENCGDKFHWPLRDTDQNDDIGLRICTDNVKAIKDADEIHVWYNKDSRGSLFDLGAAFALNKPIRLANSVTPTEKKSFENFLLMLDSLRL